MIRFLLHKIWQNKWLMFSLLIGNILLIGVVAATPMYNQATMNRILQQNLRAVQWHENQHPIIVELHYTFNVLIPAAILPHYHNTKNVLVPEIADEIQLPVSHLFEIKRMNTWHVLPAETRESSPRNRNMNILGIDLEAHVDIVRGRMPSDEIVDGNIIEVLVSDFAMFHQNLLMDERLTVTNIGRLEYYIKVVGVFEHHPGSELFWSTIHHIENQTLLVPQSLIEDYFIANYTNEYRVSAHWYQLLDYSAVNERLVAHYLEVLAALDARFNVTNSAWRFRENLSTLLEYYQLETGPLVTLLWVLQIPLYLLMFVYIYMVSTQVLALEKNVISVFKSRGASRIQLMAIYAGQSLIMILIAIPLGMGVGFLLTNIMGASSGFLQLVNRAALDVEISGIVLLYVAIASVLSFITMFFPVIRYARVTIVEHKQRKRRGNATKPLWQRFFVDVLCLGISIYGLYTLHSNEALMASTAGHDVVFIDPLLFISSSLFIIGGGLFGLRLFPYMVRFIYLLGQKLWSPQAYASLLRIMRSAHEVQYVMIFLIITLAVGIFSAHSARVIQMNNDHQIRHLAGADLVFREVWNTTAQFSGSVGESAFDTAVTQLTFQEPDFERFTNFDEVDALTRVLRGNAQALRIAPTPISVDFMGIETNTFGETVWNRADFLPIHINHFLNILAENPDGALVSSGLRHEWGLQLGDTIPIDFTFMGSNYLAAFTIVGFVDRWPGFNPVMRARLPDGTWRVDPQHLIITNLGHLQTRWGMLPYQIWMQTNTPTNQFFYDFVYQQALRIDAFHDGKGAIVESRSDPILQGTNGVLTMIFIVTLMICFVGFLIYWLLNIRQRVLQFGVFRAMGISMKRIWLMLFIEQLLVTFFAIVLGALVGELAAYFFIPLIYITAADNIIPFIIVVNIRDYINLYTFTTIMVFLSVLVLVWFVSKIKIAQALKLGED